jgi:hypothetical protein
MFPPNSGIDALASAFENFYTDGFVESYGMGVVSKVDNSLAIAIVIWLNNNSASYRRVMETLHKIVSEIRTS